MITDVIERGDLKREVRRGDGRSGQVKPDPAEASEIGQVAQGVELAQRKRT